MNLHVDKSQWTKVKLGDVATEYSRRINDPSSSDRERFVGSSCIGQWDFRVQEWESTESVTSAMKLFEKGDYLLVRRSLYASDFRERAPRAQFAGVCSGDILTIRENPEFIANGFLIGILNNPSIWSYIVANASGSITRRIKWKDLANYEFLLPPKDQQAEIAELLWALDDVLQSQFAFKDLLAITLESMAHHYTMGRALDLKEPFCDSKLGLLPESWEAVKLGDFCSFVSNGFVGKVTDFYSGKDEGIPYIQGMNVRRNHFTLGGLTYVTRDFHERQSKTKLEDGDLLTVQSGHIGETAVVPPELDGANCHAVIISRLDSNRFDSSFVARFINGPLGRMKIRGITVGTTVMHINTSDFKKFYIPKAPLDIQKEIVKNLDNLDSVLSQLEKETHDLQELKRAIISGFFGSTIGHV